MADRERLIATLQTSSKVNGPGEVRIVLRIGRKANGRNAVVLKRYRIDGGEMRFTGWAITFPEALLGQLINALELAQREARS